MKKLNQKVIQTGMFLLAMCMGISSMSFAQGKVKSQTQGTTHVVQSGSYGGNGWGSDSKSEDLVSASKSGDLFRVPVRYSTWWPISCAMT